MRQADALNILKTGANVFLTGEPGSGKSHTVNAYVAWLRSHGIEPAITASTGIAATHIHGLTIHAWSGIGIREYLSPADLDMIAGKEHVAKRVGKTAVLIIDEISMLSGETLGMVEMVCREVKRNDLPFGGMQVVLVGDFFQLPPISRPGKTASFAFQTSAWQKLNPLVCYLSEQHRQDDGAFLNVLSAIRAGSWDQSDVSRILARETDTDGLPDDVPLLHTHNMDVDRVNGEKLNQLPGKGHVYHMDSMGADPLVQGLKRGCLSPETLMLKEGAVVMCTKNQQGLGLVNGTLGIVLGFEKGTDFPMVQTYDDRIITIPPTDWAIEQEGKVRAKISQVPLRLAWAVTIHKSQGMSMDAAAIDLSRAFEYGQGYVALSRVRTIEGVHLLGFREESLHMHPAVVTRDSGFRDESDAAANAFIELEESGQREVMEKNFILASGGTLEVSKDGTKKVRISTHDLTLGLVQEGKSFKEIVKARGLTEGTVTDHIEKLRQGGRISAEDVEELLPAALLKALPHIHLAFDAMGAEKLAPLYEKFDHKYTYDEIRLARAAYTK